MIAGTTFAQSAFVKVGPEIIYDAGDRCATPHWKVADFNADGRQDFVLGVTPVSSYRAGGVPKPLMLWIAQPDGSYQEQASQLFTGSVTSAYLFSDVLVSDFNSDGRPDVFIPDAGVDIYDNNGIPTGPWLGAKPRLALSTQTGYVDVSAMFSGLTPTFSHSAAVADIDRNGSPDIYVGSIINPMPRAPGPATVSLDARAVDVNSDDYPDLVILQTVTEDNPDYAFYRGGRVQILINEGTISFEARTFDPTLYGWFPEAVPGGCDKGVWKRTGGNTFEYAFMGIAVDSTNAIVYVGKTYGAITILDDCQTEKITAVMAVYLPTDNPFEWEPFFEIPLGEVYAYRFTLP